MRERAEKAVNPEGKRLLDIKKLCFYLSLGRNNASALGKEIGARVQFGTRVLYDRKKIDEWIDGETGRQMKRTEKYYIGNRQYVTGESDLLCKTENDPLTGDGGGAH